VYSPVTGSQQTPSCVLCLRFVQQVLLSSRPGAKEPDDYFSDEQQESSDEDMEWSGNNSLFANLSIPQLDGAADESSGESPRAVAC